jgi:hypothetical protein
MELPAGGFGGEYREREKEHKAGISPAVFVRFFTLPFSLAKSRRVERQKERQRRRRKKANEKKTIYCIPNCFTVFLV